MKNHRILKREGLNLTIDKNILNDQRVLEVSTNIPDKAKVSNENKVDFDNYKILYKGAIDDKCLEEYGTLEDNKLWEDTAKEMFLKSALYLPMENKKADGELEPKQESKRFIQHNLRQKCTESKDYSLSKEHGNEYFTTYAVVDSNNNHIGKLECHNVDVKQAYYIAWVPNDYDNMYSPNAIWSTKDFDSEESAVEYLKQEFSKKNKKVESKYKVAVNTPFGKISVEQNAKSQEEANKLAVDKVKEAFRDTYKDKVFLVETKSLKKETQSINEFNEFLKLGNDYYAAFEQANFSHEPLRANSTQDVLNNLTDVQKRYIEWLGNEVSVYGDDRLEEIQRYLDFDNALNNYATGYIDYYQDNTKKPNLFGYFADYLYNHCSFNNIEELDETKECPK